VKRAAKQVAGVWGRLAGTELADDRHRLLLRTSGKRPSSGADDKRYERGGLFDNLVGDWSFSRGPPKVLDLRPADPRAE